MISKFILRKAKPDKKHGQKTQTENTESTKKNTERRKHRGENTERKHSMKTQTENTQKTHRGYLYLQIIADQQALTTAILEEVSFFGIAVKGGA